MFFSGFFCGFERCGSAAFPNFRGGIFSEKCVRTNSRILPKGELNWNGILRNIREIKDLLQLVLPEAGIIPDFSTLYA